MADDANKDAALRAVGRTIVNFQRLEHALKIAARLGPLQGSLAKVQRDMERRAERAATMTLGQAIQAWLSAADGDLEATHYTPDLFDVTVNTRFRLETEADTLNEHATALNALLAARNTLIHGGLAQFPWESPAECGRLSRELDALNEQIRVQLDFVTSVLRALSEVRPEDVQAGVGG